jgi:deazaflavin-dependent oxidoreductase (nitroreductase family)
MTDWNATVIEEFRANKGQLGGNFAGAPVLLLHSTGAKSGEPRLHPMMYQAVDPGWAVFASKSGADTNPAWFHNLVANSRAQIEVGAETVDVVARVAAPEERERIWSTQKSRYPGFAEYEQKTSRVIPVVILERV